MHCAMYMFMIMHEEQKMRLCRLRWSLHQMEPSRLRIAIKTGDCRETKPPSLARTKTSSTISRTSIPCTFQIDLAIKGFKSDNRKSLYLLKEGCIVQRLFRWVELHTILSRALGPLPSVTLGVGPQTRCQAQRLATGRARCQAPTYWLGQVDNDSVC